MSCILEIEKLPQGAWFLLDKQPYVLGGCYCPWRCPDHLPGARPAYDLSTGELLWMPRHFFVPVISHIKEMAKHFAINYSETPGYHSRTKTAASELLAGDWMWAPIQEGGKYGPFMVIKKDRNAIRSSYAVRLFYGEEFDFDQRYRAVRLPNLVRGRMI